MGEKLEAAGAEIAANTERTKAEAEKLVEQAHQEGLLKGHQQAEHFHEKLAKMKALYASDVEQDLIRSAVETAQNLVCAELDTSPSAILRFVHEALGTVSESEVIRIRANPNDTKILKENKEQLINLLQRAKDIDIREDKQVSRGILLQTESGVIDAQLKTQVEEISRVLGL